MKKKLIVFPFLALFFALNVMAQGRGNMPDENSPQVQELRKEFFNSELQFSEAEVSAFWPIFDQYKSDLKSIQQDQRKPRLDLMTDAEAEKFLDDHFIQEEKLLARRKQFVNDLRGKINVRKIALIHQTERKFKRELFQKLREKRAGARESKRRF